MKTLQNLLEAGRGARATKGLTITIKDISDVDINYLLSGLAELYDAGDFSRVEKKYINDLYKKVYKACEEVLGTEQMQEEIGSSDLEH